MDQRKLDNLAQRRAKQKTRVEQENAWTQNTTSQCPKQKQGFCQSVKGRKGNQKRDLAELQTRAPPHSGTPKTRREQKQTTRQAHPIPATDGQ
jgi:hypothetical protein